MLVDAEARLRKVFSGLSEQVLYANTGQLAALLADPLVRLVLGGEDAVARWCCQELSRRAGAIVS